KVEIVEQALHYRIEPVALGQLHAEAFGNSEGKDADGIAPPQGAENGFHIGQLGAEQFGNIGEFDGEIAGLVEPIDQMQRNQAIGLGAQDHLGLGFEMIGEARTAGDKLIEIGRFTALETAISIRTGRLAEVLDRKSTRLNSSHVKISYAVF